MKQLPAIFISLLLPLGAIAAGETVTLNPRSGVKLKFVFIRAEMPVSSVILFTGGSGKLKVKAGGVVGAGRNFLVRSRSAFAAQGLNVAVVDKPSDRKNLFGFRTSEEHARDIARVITYLRKAANVPVWLIGTSRGTISAASATARLQTGGPDGLVLTSSVLRPNRRKTKPSLLDVDLGAIRVPTLFVHHKGDGCYVTRFEDLATVRRALINVTSTALLAFEGGAIPASKPCKALSQHGYYGIENMVVAAIADWIKAHDPR